jgi:hypothetical protein
MMKVIVVFKAFISEWETPTWPPSIQMGVLPLKYSWLQF